MSKGPLWRETPLIFSNALSEITGCQVYLKLENLQPSHSFKYRGISYFIQKAKDRLGPSVHVIAASGGNAGLAAACAARVLELKCTVFIPSGVTQSTLDLLRREKAEVVVGGNTYSEALLSAQALAARESQAIIVPAYDDPIVWEGHGSMIREIHKQLPERPDAILCSVGGGGLLGGIIIGSKEVGWEEVPIIALETIGSDCFYHSMALNDGRFNSKEKVLPPGVDLMFDKQHAVFMAHFNSFSSKASGSLGASSPSPRVLKMALERPGRVITASVPDELSMDTLSRFADDQKFLVELACSTTLTPAYHPQLLKMLVRNTEIKTSASVLVFIVCGGFKIDLSTAWDYKRVVDEDSRFGQGTWTVKCDGGELFTFGREPQN